jgi:signal transduction histidine kinase
LQRIQACLSILMLRLKNEPELLELLERAQKAQDDVRRLFEDVRTYAAAVPLRFQRCDVREIWREAWENLRSSSGHVSAELREDAVGVDLFCFADPFYLRQVFRNILENSLTTGVAAVRIVIRCRPVRLGVDDALELSVCDNGPGFAVTDRARLFEPFFTTKFKGTGLGLAICKRIVESHGGRIETNEGAGPGAEVLITLPRSRP